jgi:hypothetical protein
MYNIPIKSENNNSVKQKLTKLPKNAILELVPKKEK